LEGVIEEVDDGKQQAVVGAGAAAVAGSSEDIGAFESLESSDNAKDGVEEDISARTA
jgi:hypothetical protein